MGMFHYMKVDVPNEKNIHDAFAWMIKTMKSVVVLVNNAGVMKIADFLGMVLKDSTRMVNVSIDMFEVKNKYNIIKPNSLV